MKALLYKEFKLAMHPICYIFIAMFPFMILIPSYPLGIGFIYVLTCYPILFLGANKGQQSNDLLFSTLLPIRKKDIVKARIGTCAVMHFAFIIIMCCLYPLALNLNKQLASTSPDVAAPGLTLNGFFSVVAIALLGYAIADLIFFPIYYKKGKSIVMSTLFTILGFIVYLSIFTIAMPYMPGGETYTKILCDSGYGIQFIILGAALVLYIIIHILVYKISAKRLELVDF